MQLVYAPNAPVDEARRNTTFVLRNSTWNQGRSALLARAKSAYRGVLPLCLVLMDCDAQLIEVHACTCFSLHVFLKKLFGGRVSDYNVSGGPEQRWMPSLSLQGAQGFSQSDGRESSAQRCAAVLVCLFASFTPHTRKSVEH